MTTRVPSSASATRSRLIGFVFTTTLLAAVLTAGGVAFCADAEAGRRKSEPCAACHGPDGNATIPGTPSLAGQPTFFTHWQLIKFRDGRRKDAQMSPFAANLTDDDMGDLAAFYAAQKPKPRASAVDSGKAAAGRVLTQRHHCVSCHMPKLEGQKQVARLAGQDLTYLLKLLRGFKAQTASDLDGTMTMAAQPLTADEIESLAHYIAGLMD